MALFTSGHTHWFLTILRVPVWLGHNLGPLTVTDCESKCDSIFIVISLSLSHSVKRTIWAQFPLNENDATFKCVFYAIHTAWKKTIFAFDQCKQTLIRQKNQKPNTEWTTLGWNCTKVVCTVEFNVRNYFRVMRVILSPQALHITQLHTQYSTCLTDLLTVLVIHGHPNDYV